MTVGSSSIVQHDIISYVCSWNHSEGSGVSCCNHGDCCVITVTAVAYLMWKRPVQYYRNCAVVYCIQNLHASLMLLLTIIIIMCCCLPYVETTRVFTAAASWFTHHDHTLAV
jgi:hypothetical protein